MIITSIKSDNIYMFKDFDVDFTYVRRSSHFISSNDTLFEGSHIYVRKNVIIMGGNASGKTTFGKLLCLISNYLFNGRIDGEYFSLDNIAYNKEDSSKFVVEFVIDKTMYCLEVEFKQNVLIKETIKKCKLYKSYNIKTARENLANGEVISQYIKKDNDVRSNNMLMSYFFLLNGSDNKEIEYIKNNVMYLFSLSQLGSVSSVKGSKVQIEQLNNILPKVDNSVEKVQPMYVNDVKTASYQISFNNGETLTVPDGNLLACKDRLSHGTYETIDFVNILDYMIKAKNMTVYIDEKLAHMHSELESYLIRKAMVMKSKDTQLFITTHNTDVFLLNVPMNVFLFFRRNNDGYNECIYPTDKINKNDRNLLQYYRNDYFGVLPDYSILDNYFDSMIEYGED